MIQIKLVSASDLELDKIEFIECKIFFEFRQSGNEKEMGPG